jgi:drug/metabolite transporter (DMT)-like permease
MTLHTVSGRWRLGLLLAFLTAALWATLPVALKLILRDLDALTVTWFRFAFATLGLGLWLSWRGRLAPLRQLRSRHWGLLLIAGLMLIGNYVFYLWGLDYTTAANAQLLIQLAPLLMAIGGIVVFKEHFTAAQWAGLALVAGGLLLFFSDQRGQADAPPQYALGAAFILLAAVVWAIYALLQKQLLRHLGSQTILCCIYLLATLLLLPTADLGALRGLSAAAWWALLYCALNTLGAYGAFAEALAHWEASRVSVVLALTPLLTLATVELLHRVVPEWVTPERIGTYGVLGALLVVSGSIITSLFGRRKRAI